ncbi:MAG: cobalamin-binding protein [Desulfuromonadales bacterium]|jgi:iron complex transport system substrate-binding protein
MLRALLLLILSLFVASNVAARVLVDQMGRSVDVVSPLTRVVALAPNLTEISFEVGGGAALVGVTRFATHPAAATELPRVGSYVALDLEKIVSLKPQLCLAIRDGNPKADIDRLESLGIPVYVFDPQSLEEILDTVTRLGEIFGTQSRAQHLVAGYRARLERVTRSAAEIPERVRVFFQIDADPIISIGSNTFLHRLLTRAGGVNLAADRVGYPRYTWEELLMLQPEVVFITSMGGGLSAAELRRRWQAWPQIPAVRHDQLYVVDADLFDRPTPRLIDGLETLVSLLQQANTAWPSVSGTDR